MIHPRSVRTAAHVRDHYEALDRPYREIWGEHVHHGYWPIAGADPRRAVEALVDLVIDRLDLRSGQTVADIGCGYGAAAEYILARHDVAITGFSLSPAQIAIAAARRPAQGRATFLCRDWLANGQPDASCDRAYAIESSEHFEDKAAFFAEASRLLRPGGRLVVCAWLAADDPSEWAVKHLLEPICREGALPSLGSRRDYEALARAAGFASVGFDDIGPHVHRTWWIVARRLLGKLVTQAEYRRLLVTAGPANRAFILSIPRLWWALRSRAMRYGVFVWEKP